MHPHVDSADTDQDAPAESHTEPEEEGVLGEIKTWHQTNSIDIRKMAENGSAKTIQKIDLQCVHETSLTAFPLSILLNMTKYTEVEAPEHCRALTATFSIT